VPIRTDRPGSPSSGGARMAIPGEVV